MLWQYAINDNPSGVIQLVDRQWVVDLYRTYETFDDVGNVTGQIQHLVKREELGDFDGRTKMGIGENPDNHQCQKI